jgi:hypothetical protein
MTLALVAALAAGATAFAGGSTGLRLIQRGTSAGGQTWVQRARADHGRIVVKLEIPARQMVAGGTLSSRLTPKIPLRVAHGSGLGRAEDEYELDGFVYRTVRRLRVKTVRRVVTFRPRPAPKRARARWPQLAEARFFVHFFEAGGRPTRIEALDAHGRVLASKSVVIPTS